MRKRTINTLVNNLRKVSLSELRSVAGEFKSSEDRVMLLAKLKGLEVFLQETPTITSNKRYNLYVTGNYRNGRGDLKSFIQSIKAFRIITNWGLKEAKMALDECNSGGKVIIKSNLSKGEVEDLQRTFRASGFDTVIEES